MRRQWHYIWLLLWVMAALLATFRVEAGEQQDKRRLRIAVVDTGLTPGDSRFDVCADGYHDETGTGVDDVVGHGTHVAGIITALTNRRACLLICKFFVAYSSGLESVNRSARCFDWAVSQHADYINYSAGGPDAVLADKAALVRAVRAGATPCVAAGNDHKNIDFVHGHYYPASYRIQGVRVVGSLGLDGNPTNSSNFGNTVTDWVPGDSIFSALPDDKAGLMSGTSMSTAVATGLYARERIGLPNLPLAEIRSFLVRYWTRAGAAGR